MKKVFATILAVIYLATSAGAAVNLHFCMGNLYGASLLKKDICGKCGMKNSHGCCEDRVKVIKAQDVHQSINATTFQPPFAILQKEYYLAEHLSLPLISNITAHNNGPPLSPSTPVYILHCVFRL